MKVIADIESINKFVVYLDENYSSDVVSQLMRAAIIGRRLFIYYKEDGADCKLRTSNQLLIQLTCLLARDGKVTKVSCLEDAMSVYECLQHESL